MSVCVWATVTVGGGVDSWNDSIMTAPEQGAALNPVANDNDPTAALCGLE